jgi:hypothetical protein
MKNNLVHRNVFALTLIPLLSFALISCESEPVLDSVDNFDHIVLTPLADDVALPSDEFILSMEGLGSLAAIADTNLSWIDMIHYAVDDEYLAQAEYQLILETYGSIKPYTNIVLSEGTHLSLLEQLCTIYGLPFPSDPSVGHVVLPTSLIAAAHIGVGAEINNIDMYRYFMTLPIETNMTSVFQLLMDASIRHLAAFERQVTRLGG